MISKTALRAEMRALRRRLAAETPDAARRAAANFPADVALEAGCDGYLAKPVPPLQLVREVARALASAKVA